MVTSSISINVGGTCQAFWRAAKRGLGPVPDAFRRQVNDLNTFDSHAVLGTNETSPVHRDETGIVFWRVAARPDDPWSPFCLRLGSLSSPRANPGAWLVAGKSLRQPFGTVLCYSLSLSLLLHSVESRPLSDDDAEPSPEIEDPGRPFRRLIQAILLASLQDYVGSQDRQTFLEARCFLFPESTDKKEHLARLLECSGLDAGWFRERCEQLRLRAVAPEGQAASASRYAVKRRVRERCRQAF